MRSSSSLLAFGCNSRMVSLDACIMLWLIDLTRPKSFAGGAFRISSIWTRSASGLVSADCVRIVCHLSHVVLARVYEIIGWVSTDERRAASVLLVGYTVHVDESNVTGKGASMTNVDIAHWRLHNQLIAQRILEKPVDVVQWLGAVQAQDYAAAKWAVGLRLQSATDDAIEQACTEGAILRTHVMRPTWHFVSPTDIRWLLALTAPRVNALNAYYYRQQELDDAVFRSSNAVLIKALQGGKQLTRAELVSALQQAGIASENILRFTLIMMRAELDGLICNGARRGKQFTYALLDERVPPAKTFEHDEALAEFVRRYFTSHGPATLQDFVWWSGLSMAEAKTGLELVKSQLMHEDVDGQTYWFATSTLPAKDLAQTTYLLPSFDEYTVGYTDRSAVFDKSHTNKLNAWGNILGSYTMVLNGQIVGIWKRTIKKDTVIINASPFTSLNEAETRAFMVAADRYGAFLERAVNVAFQVE